MWLLDDPEFLQVPGSGPRIAEIGQQLRDANQSRNLTLVIGNGLSRSAVWQAGLKSTYQRELASWNNVVTDAYKRVFKDTVLENLKANDLIMAQAVANWEDERRKSLLQDIHAGTKDVSPSYLHRIVAELKPRYVITTNYDLLVEAAFLQDEWFCYVGTGWKKPHQAACSDEKAIIFKMHGTLPTSRENRNNYDQDFTSEESAYPTVVIAERDYDKCTRELVFCESQERQGIFWKALDNVLFIVGKGVYWEDLSLMWALRWRTRKEGHHRPAYWLVDSPFDSGDQILTLRNLGITAIEMNLPHQRDTGRFFFAYAEAFRTLFGEELKAVRSMQDDREIVDRRRTLVSYPTLVAIGLSAKNLAGCPEQEDLSLRREGRKNMLLKDPDEYAGGSALTAVGVCSELCNSYKERVERVPLPHCALVSMIGRDDAGKEVRRFCRKGKIDDDAVIARGPATWRSIVLLHRPGENEKPAVYGPQRVFLDIKPPGDPFIELRANGDRQLRANGDRQFEAMLSPKKNRELRVVYLDRWFTFSKEDCTNEKDRRNFRGFLAESKYEAILKEMANERVDVVYETGGKGTHNATLEKRLARFINILTSSFPFFLTKIADPAKQIHTFDHEVNTIEEMLRGPEFQHGDEWKPVPNDWVTRAKDFLERSRRPRWLIVTLHHVGALAVELDGNPPVVPDRAHWNQERRDPEYSRCRRYIPRCFSICLAAIRRDHGSRGTKLSRRSQATARALYSFRGSMCSRAVQDVQDD